MALVTNQAIMIIHDYFNLDLLGVSLSQVHIPRTTTQALLRVICSVNVKGRI